MSHKIGVRRQTSTYSRVVGVAVNPRKIALLTIILLVSTWELARSKANSLVGSAVDTSGAVAAGATLAAASQGGRSQPRRCERLARNRELCTYLGLIGMIGEPNIDRRKK